MTKGVVQLKKLSEYLEEMEEVDDVFKRKFAFDVVKMSNRNWANLTLDFLCKGIQEQRNKDLIFYFDHVSPKPTVTPYVRNFSSLLDWGDFEIKSILNQFDKIGGYDSEGVVVHFTMDEGTKVDEKSSGNEGGVSQISSRDVFVMTSTLIIVASLLLRQNMILAKHFGSEMLSDLQAQSAQEMDLKHGLEGQSSHLLTQLTGLHTCQTATLNQFETHDLVLNQSRLS
ncbi:hypothetical protein RHSIM_RhsimUnG0167100 [Rhododendron simsii]|uniref:Uncharacterized protein n=1 Tax=Rhododendron simsii TaxID=118357 RepID=A0A834FWD6_RHOSS|nr:hypothetical protein RHSIM_RhsimUnG0167100 [Rhododendron simsii]